MKQLMAGKFWLDLILFATGFRFQYKGFHVPLFWYGYRLLKLGFADNYYLQQFVSIIGVSFENKPLEWGQIVA